MGGISWPARWPDVEAAMRWLRANGVTEDASQIAEDVTVQGGSIHYTVVTRAHGGGMPHQVQQRVTFREANASGVG